MVGISLVGYGAYSLYEEEGYTISFTNSTNAAKFKKSLSPALFYLYFGGLVVVGLTMITVSVLGFLHRISG